MAQPNFYSAIYAVIKNEKGEILFSRRKNTGYKDGFFQFPAGHIEGKETMKQACIRELKEELDINVLEDDLKIIHISHRVCPDRVYYDIYLEVEKYSGKIKINEIDKCSELKFIDIDNLPEEKFVTYDINCLKLANNNIPFSDIITD